jgi:hypothetical protein
MKKSKAQRVREYFRKYKLATPKEVGAKFGVAMPMVYKIRKEVHAEFIDRSNAPIIEYGFVNAPSVNPQITDAVTQSAREVQEGGTHYKTMGVQPWDVVDTWPKEQQIGYYRGGALKYIMRMGAKDQSATEIAKGKHYMQKLLEVLG